MKSCVLVYGSSVAEVGRVLLGVKAVPLAIVHGQHDDVLALLGMLLHKHLLEERYLPELVGRDEVHLKIITVCYYLSEERVTHRLQDV